MRSLAILMFLLAVGLLVNFVYAQQPNPKADPSDKYQVQRGQLVYSFCSFCHGANLEGQPSWRTRKPDGKLPARRMMKPATPWHHPDDVLFGIIKQGLVPPYAPLNYKSDMPAWAAHSDEDIWAVLASIKSCWPEETRKIQAEINRDFQR